MSSSKGLHSLYVYCPLVEPRMMGDAKVPLLRIVPVEGRDGEMIIFNPVFKASRPRVFAPFFNKGMAALKSPPKILPSPCPLRYRLPANTGYPFPAWWISDRGNRYRGQHGLYSAIRKRTSGGDTSL
jgi:hypothetical protein